jgi:hypothetical protein
MIVIPEKFNKFNLKDYSYNKGQKFRLAQNADFLIINKRREQAQKEIYKCSLTLCKNEYSEFQEFVYSDLKNGSYPFQCKLRIDNQLVDCVVKIISDLNISFTNENKIEIGFELIKLYEQI